MSVRVFILLVSIYFFFPPCSYAQISADSISPLVDSLIQVSRIYTGEAKFEEATAISEMAGIEALACCGENSATYAAYCFNEGRIRDFMGHTKEAIPWYVQSRELRGKILGKNHLEYGKSCNNLAIVYDELNRYEEAEPLYLEVLAIREAAAGRRSAICAAVLANLGGMYSSMGDNDIAEQMIMEALDIRQQILGKNVPLYGQNLVLLASHYHGIHNYKDAEPLLLEAKRIFDAQEQLYFYDYLKVLEHLGQLYVSLYDFEKGQSYLEQAAKLVEDTYGKENRLYANSLNYLAALAMETKQVEESEAYLQEELAILDRTGYLNGEYYGVALQDLSRIYHQQGNLNDALETLDRSLEILEKTIPPEHRWYRYALWEKATIQQNLKNYEAAATILRRIEALEQKPLATAVRHLSDQELSTFTKEYYEYLSQGLALAEHLPEITDLFYNKILRYKGFLLSNAVTVRQNAQENENTKILYRQLRGLNRRLAALYSNYQADPKEVLELETQAEILEKEMVRQQAQYHQMAFDVNWETVQSQLSTNEAALELVAYQQFSRPNDPLKTYYAGLLLLPDAKKPIFLRLGAEDSLANLLKVSTNDVEAINGLYQWANSGQKLYQLAWKPIQVILDEHPAINKIFISSDGLLHRINISAIPTTADQVVAQRHEVVTLTSTRNLLLDRLNTAPDQQTAILYGGIDYGKAEPITSETNADDSSVSETRGAYTAAVRGYDPNNGYWQQLTWTEVEIMYADEVLQAAGYTTNLYMAEEATEIQFKRIVEKNTRE